MGVTLKPLTLLLIFALASSSLIMVESASAEPIPKPSVPEFTVQFENNSIIIKIQKQQFDNAGLDIHLSHTVRVKSNSGQDWKIIEGPRNSGSYYDTSSLSASIYRYQIEGYLVLNYYWNWQTNVVKTFEGDLYFYSGDQVSFQVQASIGRVAELPMPLGGNQFIGETSEWSDSQTIVLTPEFVATPAPILTQTPEAQIDYLPFVVPVVLVAVVTVLGVCLVVYDFKKKTSV